MWLGIEILRDSQSLFSGKLPGTSEKITILCDAIIHYHETDGSKNKYAFDKLIPIVKEHGTDEQKKRTIDKIMQSDDYEII